MYCPTHPKTDCICVEQNISNICIKFCHGPLAEWVLIQYKEDNITTGNILSPSILAQGVTITGNYCKSEGHPITCHEGMVVKKKCSSTNTQPWHMEGFSGQCNAMALLPTGKRNAAYYPKICNSHFLQHPMHPAIHCYITFMAAEATLNIPRINQSINQYLRS